MDIVHLIETKLVKSRVEETETSSCMYAEIEQAIVLEPCEGKPARGRLYACWRKLMELNGSKVAVPGSLAGFSALQEDVHRPGPGGPSKPQHRSGSGREVRLVSAEDLSTSLSLLPDTRGRFGRGSSPSGPSQIFRSPPETESFP